MPNDLCFVLMPFGKRPDLSGALVDFDAVYRQLIAPAIREAGLDPIRADEEMTGGIIDRPMFERLIFCKFAVADLTTANAKVFYELGLRHAVLYQLVDGYPDIDQTKTAVFRGRVEYSAQQKQQLSSARAKGVVALRAAEREMGNLASVEAGVLIDLFLSCLRARGMGAGDHGAQPPPRPRGASAPG